MIENKRQVGNVGELVAIKYLQKNGYQIIENNFTISGGEIDIIAKKDSKIIFFEVKYRKSMSYGTPEEAMTKTKKLAILRSINFYCLKKRLNIDSVSLDFLAIIDKPDFGYSVKHYRNISLEM